MIHYAIMVADLFHYGHVEYLKQIYAMKNPGDLVFIGILDDETVKAYKRTPVLSIDCRKKVLEACRYVDKVLTDVPPIISKDYIDLHSIDYVYVPDNISHSEFALRFTYPNSIGIIRKLNYTTSISTTDIIKRIKSADIY